MSQRFKPLLALAMLATPFVADAHAATVVALGASNTLNATPQIQGRLSAMGIKVVMLPNGMLRELPRQPDGQHLTPEGYHMPAEQLVGEVARALGK